MEHESTRYLKNILVERLKVRYLQLRSNITFYSMEYCIGDYHKIGLTEKEVECIKNRGYTYLLYFKDFNVHQKENFSNLYQKEAYDKI